MMNQKNMKMSYFKQGFALRYVIYLVLLLWVKNSVGLVERWENIETIKPFSLFSVHATSTNDVFAATYDNAEGSFIYYSYNAGASWEKVPTKGNNYAMAMSGNGKTLCAAGTKAYCANATQTLGWDVFELNFHSSGHDVRSVEQEGFAMVGSFGLNDEVFNGVAYLKNFDYAWSLYDIQLDRKEGYYALQSSFPSENMWYVVSGSWPKQNEIIASILSGRLVMVPTGKYFFGYQYEYLTLPPASANQKYVGAISKTTDGGKTWQKIFDSNNEYFINQIDCIDGGEACIAVGEGPEKAVVLKTLDGGANWNIALTLNSTYSLHACEMLSATTYWVGGGMVAPFPSDDTTAHLRVGGGSGNEVTNFIGVYYKTINGGDDWSMFTGQGYVYDFTFFNEKVGYAATIFRDRCGIAKLKLV